MKMPTLSLTSAGLTATPGDVYCEERDLRFPALFRTHHVITRDEAIAELKTPNGAGDFYGYVFEPEVQEALIPCGSLKHERASGIHLGDQTESILVRHHENPSESIGYMKGLADRTFGSQCALDLNVCCFKGKVFTKHNIPTWIEWPGPLIVYMTELKLSSTRWMRAQVGGDVFEMGTMPGGV